MKLHPQADSIKLRPPSVDSKFLPCKLPFDEVWLFTECYGIPYVATPRVIALNLLFGGKDNKAQSTDGHGEGVIEVGYDIRRCEAGKGGCGKELRTVGDDGLNNA